MLTYSPYLTAYKIPFPFQKMSQQITLCLIRSKVSFGLLANGVLLWQLVLNSTTNISPNVNKMKIATTPTTATLSKVLVWFLCLMAYQPM